MEMQEGLMVEVVEVVELPVVMPVEQEQSLEDQFLYMQIK
jgi:hypothetical protein